MSFGTRPNRHVMLGLVLVWRLKSFRLDRRSTSVVPHPFQKVPRVSSPPPLGANHRVLPAYARPFSCFGMVSHDAYPERTQQIYISSTKFLLQPDAPNISQHRH